MASFCVKTLAVSEEDDDLLDKPAGIQWTGPDRDRQAGKVSLLVFCWYWLKVQPALTDAFEQNVVETGDRPLVVGSSV